MSDITPLNDPELNQLEQRLLAVKLEPTAQQRERLLYSCGLAAGRAQVRWRVRAMSTATVLLTFVCAGLSFQLSAKMSPESNNLIPTETSIAEGENADSKNSLFAAMPQQVDKNRGRHLRAGMSYRQFLEIEKLRKAESLNAIPPESSPKSVLTATGGSWPLDL